MNTFRKSLGIILSVVMLATMFAAAAVTASANYDDEKHMYELNDVVTGEDSVKEYRFYMPDEWRNEYNDRYDGESLDSCCAGIYWWSGTKNCSEEQYNVYGELGGWPGYAVAERDDSDKNIFVADVPDDVDTIIWNNTVTAHNDNDNTGLREASAQTQNINCEYYDEGEDVYGFYPEGIDSFNGMIFVCEMGETTQSEYVTPQAYKGEWFYYYGNGQYGINKTPVAGEVYSGGRWPGRDEPDTDYPEPVETTAPEETTAVEETTDAPETTTGEFTTEATEETMEISTMPTYDVDSEKNVKEANPMKVKVDYDEDESSIRLSRNEVTYYGEVVVYPFEVTDAEGEVTYTMTFGREDCFSVDENTGAVTIKSAIRPGTYKVKVKIHAAGNENYKSSTKTIQAIFKISDDPFEPATQATETTTAIEETTDAPETTTVAEETTNAPEATTKAQELNTTAPTEPKTQGMPMVTKAPTRSAVAPAKRPNTVKATAKVKKVSKTTLKKGKTTLKLIKVKNANGKVTFKLVKKGTSKKLFKKLRINKTTGAITLKKGTYKKGTYKIKVQITVKGDKNYEDAKLVKTVKVKIK